MSRPALDAAAGRAVTIERILRAPPERVWSAFTDPRHLGEWFNEAPGGITQVLELDVRPGGRMRLVIPPDEPAHPDVGSYLGLFLVVEPHRELGLCVVDPGRWASAMVRFRFEADDDGGTRLRFESSLPSEAAREETTSAWKRCFEKLAACVSLGRGA